MAKVCVWHSGGEQRCARDAREEYQSMSRGYYWDFDDRFRLMLQQYEGT